MKVYRFEKNTTNRLQTILNGEIHLSCPEVFNDLDDCKIHSIFTPEIDNQHYTKLKKCIDILYPEKEHNYFPFPDETLADLKKFFDTFNSKENLLISRITRANIVKKFQGHLRKTTGVCCFFKDVPTHPLMWAHYADSHKGFCIEYEVPTESLLLPVKYTTEKLEPSLHELLLCPHETQIRILTTKSIEWQHEREARLIYSDIFKNEETGENIDLPVGMYATKIITGAKFDKNQNNDLINQIKTKLNADTVPYKKFIAHLTENKS